MQRVQYSLIFSRMRKAWRFEYSQAKPEVDTVLVSKITISLPSFSILFFVVIVLSYFIIIYLSSFLFFTSPPNFFLSLQDWKKLALVLLLVFIPLLRKKITLWWDTRFTITLTQHGKDALCAWRICLSLGQKITMMLQLPCGRN